MICPRMTVATSRTASSAPLQNRRPSPATTRFTRRGRPVLCEPSLRKRRLGRHPAQSSSSGGRSDNLDLQFKCNSRPEQYVGLGSVGQPEDICRCGSTEVHNKVAVFLRDLCLAVPEPL